MPYHSPNGTAGEWIEDPYNEYGHVYTGPGTSVVLCIRCIRFDRFQDFVYHSISSCHRRVEATCTLSMLTTYRKSSSLVSFQPALEHTLRSLAKKHTEEWLQAKGYNNVETTRIPAWRRQNMADLTNAFDFNHVRFRSLSIELRL